MRPMVTTVPPPVFEITQTFPELAALRARATGGDLPGALASLSQRRGPDADAHTTASRVLAEAPGLDAPLEQYLADHPDDREAGTLLAHRAVIAARGAPDAGVHLRRAEELLIRLCARDPTDAAAWHLRLVTARGLGLGAAESRRRFERLHAIDPHHVAGRRELIFGLTPAHGGTWDDVLFIARGFSAASGAGDPGCVVVATAHLVHWLDETGGGETTMLREPDVVAELEEAAARFLDAPCPAPYGWVSAHSEFAVALGLARRRGRSSRHFQALGPAMSAPVWAIAHQHHADLGTIRDLALAEGRRR